MDFLTYRKKKRLKMNELWLFQTTFVVSVATLYFHCSPPATWTQEILRTFNFRSQLPPPSVFNRPCAFKSLAISLTLSRTAAVSYIRGASQAKLPYSSLRYVFLDRVWPRFRPSDLTNGTFRGTRYHAGSSFESGYFFFSCFSFLFFTRFTHGALFLLPPLFC